MKLNKIFTLATLATTMFFATSCSDDFSYDGRGAWDADANYANLYFPTTSSAEELDPIAETASTIVLCRRNTSGALTVPVKVAENTDDVFTVGDASFADGDSVATIAISFNKAAIGEPYTLRLELEGSEFVSSYSENISYTYTVTRVKWNDVGFYYDANGEKVEGWAMYTDDFITTFFGVDNVIFPTKLQERDDMPGYFRMINTYHENYPYNDPGDWDTSKDYYIYIDATDPDEVTIPQFCELGMDWGYGMFGVYSLAGYYLARGNEATAAENYGTYANGVITFPAGSLLLSMADYNSGGLYTANGSGAFKLVINPDLNPYNADMTSDEDFVWEEVYAGSFESNQMGTQKDGVKLYVGTCVNTTDSCDVRFKNEYGTAYKIESPYADGYNLYFAVDSAGEVKLPEELKYQDTGMKAVGSDVYAAIAAGASTFTERTVSLKITFRTMSDDNNNYIEFGTAEEVLSYITWTKVGTGIYTYTLVFADYDEETEEDIPVEDGPLEIYQRDDQPSVYKVTDWGYGAEFFFTWDGKEKVTVPASPTGYVYGSYGEIYISDIPTYSSQYSYTDFPCRYNAETQTFAFNVIYWVSAGNFGNGIETLKVTWDAAAARGLQAKHTAVKPSSNLKLIKGETPFSSRFSGKKVQKPKHGEFKNPGTPLF